EAHVDRAVAGGPKARHQAGAQDRGLAEAALAEQHGEQLSLHASRQLGDLVLAAVEESARRLAERVEAEPGLRRIDGRLGHWKTIALRAAVFAFGAAVRIMGADHHTAPPRRESRRSAPV